MPYAKQITSWSFSRYQLWKQCPLKARLKFIDRLPEPGSAAMDRGSEIHKGIEDYIKGLITRVNKDWNPKLFGVLLKDIKSKRKRDIESVTVEDTWAFRADWSETTFDDWNNCWLRVKVDCSVVGGTEDNVVIDIYDWKTGRYRPNDEMSYAMQLDLYALGALTLYRDIKEVAVKPQLIYIDEGVQHSPATYTKTDLPRLRKEWEARVKPMLADMKFAPKPNNLCRFCHYRAGNGGPCKF